MKFNEVQDGPKIGTIFVRLNFTKYEPIWKIISLSDSIRTFDAVVQRARHLGLRSVGRRFKSCSRQRCVTTLASCLHLCASVTKQYNLVTAKGQWCSVAGEVTAGVAESNGSLPPGGWLTVTCRLTACTLGSAPGPTLGIEYGKPLPLPLKITPHIKCVATLPCELWNVKCLKSNTERKTTSVTTRVKKLTPGNNGFIISVIV